MKDAAAAHLTQQQNPGWKAQLRELGEGLWWIVKVIRDVTVGILLLPLLLLLGSLLYYPLAIAVIGAVVLVAAILMWAWRTVF